MSFPTAFYEQNFNTQRDQWEKLLKTELKLESVETKTSKKLRETGNWPTLSLEAPAEIHLASPTRWMKAAQTYYHLPDDWKSSLLEDVKGGVRVFFFSKTPTAEVTTFMKTVPHADEVELVNLEDVLSAKEVEEGGGQAVQELASLSVKLIEAAQTGKNVSAGVYVDSEFFKNIAKIRAAKLLIQKIWEETGSIGKVKVVALTSYREWTLFERYSNLLRNEVAVASAYIAGADLVQSSGYQIIFERELDMMDPEHFERSLRLARNTSHILALESMLGLQEDAAYGSFHLESLTQKLAAEAWSLMQKILGGYSVLEDVKKVKEERMLAVRTRKHILAGMNDFPDVKETLHLTKLPQEKSFRVARDFENLRITMESGKKPKVFVALLGDHAALNARLNFVKNYFELIGLEVVEGSDLSGRKEEIIVLCGTDEHYQSMTIPTLTGKDVFLAGKFEISGVQNIYAGQNVYDVLKTIVSKWGKA